MITLRRKKDATFRLYLINPKFSYKHYGAQDEFAKLIGKKRATVPLALPLIAAFTPGHYKIRIIDEELDRIPWDEKPDIVGITSVMTTAGRAYEIADRFRGMGVPVVMGGSYATFMSEEVLEHCDSVVIGEAEGVWAELLEDFERGELKRSYQSAEKASFKKSPIPRWDLVDVDAITTLSVQTTRGCPFNCDFCLVNKMFGHKMRFREIDDIVREIKSLPIKRLFFVDDNLAIKKSYARKLVAALKPLKITWICQTSLAIARDPGLLRSMAEAGCLSILIGFESLDPAALKESGKRHNKIELYEDAIRTIHAAGINVLASFIVGFDTDTVETFQSIQDFVERNNILNTMMCILAAAPGTVLYTRMKEQGRLCNDRPELLSGVTPCMHYLNISQMDMLTEYYKMLKKLYAFDSLERRARASFSEGWFAHTASGEEVSLVEKIVTSAKIVKWYVTTRDSEKRKLFTTVFALMREGKVSPSTAVFFLISMQAIHIFLEQSEGKMENLKRIIERVDRGPWKDQMAIADSTARIAQ